MGIEFGSTRIKACLIGPGHGAVATGSHTWTNTLDAGLWTYDLGEVWSGVQSAVGELLADADRHYGVRPATLRAMGVSAMMHGYLPFDVRGDLLVPFRTWRNTSTGRAASELSDRLGLNIPMRWSVAHLYQAVLDHEDHVPRIDFLATLAGYVHWKLTGRRVLGVGDASGMFPIDPETRTYDAEALCAADELLTRHGFAPNLEDVLPTVLVAGRDAGRLTADGATLLDPAGTIRPGTPLCPPEGDAGTGMTATHSIAPRTGNVSVGTSIFAMVVLEKPLRNVHPEIDVVTTPAGAPAAMVHCNNGASELDGWAAVFRQFASAIGCDVSPDRAFEALLEAALSGERDGGGILAYNHVSGEPIAGGLTEGRPLIVRTPGSRLSLANVARSMMYGVFGTLSLGMRILAEEGVGLDALYAHGGLFRTAKVAQRLLAAAVDTPVSVGRSAAEGGAWGMAVLAAYLGSAEPDLDAFLAAEVFAGDELTVEKPNPDDVRGYRAFLETYESGLAVERTAVDVLTATRHVEVR
nr:FGGY-family carbohydrate kinase [Spelaeicoccus albus]